MATDIDRKRLWGRAGSRCSICNVALTRLDGLDTIVGDEAHIRSRRERGPRYDAKYPFDSRDNYENLILLCKAHHKLVDDNADVFSVELLEGIKRRHETRVDRALSGDTIGWISPPVLEVVNDGTTLMRIIAAAMAFVLGHDHPADVSDAEAIGSFLQDAQDWGEIADEAGAGGRVEGAMRMHEQIIDLNRLGYVVIAGLGRYRLASDFDVPAAAIHVGPFDRLCVDLEAAGQGQPPAS